MLDEELCVKICNSQRNFLDEFVINNVPADGLSMNMFYHKYVNTTKNVILLYVQFTVQLAFVTMLFR